MKFGLFKKQEITTEKSTLLETKQFKKGEILFRQGDKSHNMYILQKGKVEIYVDDQLINTISKSGAIIGESAALFKQPRSATVKVIEDSEFIVVPGEYMDRIIMEKPEIGLNLLRTVVERLHNAGKQIARLEKLVIDYQNEVNKIKGESIKNREYKLGELFYNTGIITKSQLEECLNIQKKYAQRGIKKSIGNILIEKGYATTFQVIQVMKLQKSLLEEEH